MTSEVTGSWLVEGAIDGEIMKLGEPLSFWGGFDAVEGQIIDQAHPQAGSIVSGKVVAIPGSRGSSGTPGVLGESLRRGTGPAALIVTKADVNLVTGSLAAATLYGTHCPILLVDQTTFDGLVDGDPISVS